MTFTVELTDTEAACLWADVTYSGRNPKPMPDIVTGIVRDRAQKAVKFFEPYCDGIKQAKALFAEQGQ